MKITKSREYPHTEYIQVGSYKVGWRELAEILLIEMGPVELQESRLKEILSRYEKDGNFTVAERKTKY